MCRHWLDQKVGCLQSPWDEGMQLRGHFSSSTLVSLLASWVPVDTKASRQDTAERLGMWLNVADAMTLHAAHHSFRIPAAATPALTGVQLDDACKQVHVTLAATLISMPLPEGADATFATYHQRYLDSQRHMALRIEALREQVRQVLTQASPRLAQLAALDVVMDQALGAREHKLLASVPALLELRFAQLCQPPSSEENPSPVGVAALGPGAFVHDMRAVLLAELDVRMQPVQGLVEAFNSELKK